MAVAVPPIYAPIPTPARLTIFQRFIAGVSAAAAFTVLALAYHLPPDPSGTGTHTGLGLPRCVWLYATGLPCPSCGMTTSFSYFAHGNVLASLWIQPMATLLALLTGMYFWAAAYAAISGNDITRLTRRWRWQMIVPSLIVLAIAAWGWKIYIHLHGLDGWR